MFVTNKQYILISMQRIGFSTYNLVGSTNSYRCRPMLALWPSGHPSAPISLNHRADLEQVHFAFATPSVSERDDRRYADDPLWRDLILFYEYFHGDNGRGCGASHQTGWTSLVVRLLDKFLRRSHPQELTTLQTTSTSSGSINSR